MKQYLFALTLICMIPMAQAQNVMEKTIKVTGIGTVDVVPDKALVSMSVENKGKDANEIKQLNDQAVSKVLAAAKNLGITDKDIQTTFVNLNKSYDYNTKKHDYVANQTIKLTIKDLSTYDKVMNGLLDSGINRINSVSLESSKLKQLKSEARKKAVADAKMKAEEYAGVLNQKVGSALHIKEQEETTHQPYPQFAKTRMMSMESNDSGQGPTLATGEMSVESSIIITFALN